jgi:hypothetical protein
MKARVTFAAALAFVLVTVVPLIARATTSTITIVMTGPAISVDISVEPTGWQISGVRLNSSYARSFTLTNTGTVEVETSIVGTNAEGSGYEWLLDTSPGQNRYEVEYDVEGPGQDGNVTLEATDFIERLTEGQSRDFSLTVKTPTAGDVPAAGEALEATVSISAVAR